MIYVLRSVRSLGIFAVIVFAMMLFAYPPNPNDRILLGSFFGSLFLWVSSLLTFIFFRIRVRATSGQVVYSHILPALRSGLLLGFGITFTLVLSTLEILTVWNALLVWTALGLVELFFRSAK